MHYHYTGTMPTWWPFKPRVTWYLFNGIDFAYGTQVYVIMHGALTIIPYSRVACGAD